MSIEAMQVLLREEGLDGWLFCDFRGSDPLAYRILKLSPERLVTRRWFYFVPAQGTPIKLVHRIERSSLDSLPGEKRVYLRWQQLEAELAHLLRGSHRVAMQYSPRNAIPYVSRVDAGIIEIVTGFGVQVISSADLVAYFEATLDDDQVHAHRQASADLVAAMSDTFDEVRRRRSQGPVTEREIHAYLMAELDRMGLEYDHPPIVASGPNSADPHAVVSDRVIGNGEVLLIDAWGKRRAAGSIFADYTRMGFTGDVIPDRVAAVFDAVRRGRDAAIELISKGLAAGRTLRGCEVDDAARGVIEAAGFGEYFAHRTGHSIHEALHGNGANMDNLETRDERRLLRSTLFSVEPGIYLDGEFGVRSEVNVLIDKDNHPQVTGVVQTELEIC